MSIDQCLHSLFGASKLAADVLVQEYGRYFGMPTACFRGGCLTGPAHAGAELHGFLAYLMKCCVIGRPYHVFGYKGKQVRDNIHSFDLVETFAAFVDQPRVAEVYNMGGGAFAIARCWKRFRCVKKSAAANSPGIIRKPTASAITSGGSAMCGNFNRIIRSGSFVSDCGKFWSKSSARLRTVDLDRHDPRAASKRAVNFLVFALSGKGV